MLCRAWSSVAALAAALLLTIVPWLAPPAAARSWATGEELMQVLTDTRGYTWTPVTLADGSQAMWSVAGEEEARELLEHAMTGTGGIVLVAEPLDVPAIAAVLASPLAGGGWGVPEVEDIVSVLAPEASGWAQKTFMHAQSVAVSGSAFDESYQVPAGGLRITGGGEQGVVQLLLTPASSDGRGTLPTPDAAGRVSFGDGDHRVGVDVLPGTYRTRDPDRLCTWQRFDDPATDADPVAMRSAPGYAVVTILSTDIRFVSSGCGAWSDDLSAVLLPGAVVPDGMFIVGTDLVPGTYENGGDTDPDEPHGSLCFWARRPDFADPSHALDSGLGRQRFRITIEPTDAGFESRGCEVWIRVD